jgi:hypothetical protein
MATRRGSKKVQGKENSLNPSHWAWPNIVIISEETNILVPEQLPPTNIEPIDGSIRLKHAVRQN